MTTLHITIHIYLDVLLFMCIASQKGKFSAFDKIVVTDCGQIDFNLVSRVFMENQPGVHNTFATACVPIFGMNSVRICNNKSTKSRCNKYHILITGSGYPQSTTEYSQTSV